MLMAYNAESCCTVCTGLQRLDPYLRCTLVYREHTAVWPSTTVPWGPHEAQQQSTGKAEKVFGQRLCLSR